MLLYLLKSALLLALLYGCFALLLSRETFHRFNRVALLCVLVASLLLPLVQLTLDKPDFLSFNTSSASGFATNSSPLDVEEALNGEVTQPGDGTISQAPWRGIEGVSLLSLLYLAGLLASVGMCVFLLFRFRQEAKGGTRTRDDQGNVVIIHGGDFAPYSFFHYIFISVSDYEQNRKPILAHEQAHIRLGHSWDLLLLEMVKSIQWFNPFVYLLGRDLKAVHEYEADNAVLNLGIDAKSYQLLLVTKAVGNRLQTLGNNLSHHSLKKRIAMMNKNRSNSWLMTKAVVLPALMAMAVVAFARQKTETLPVSNEQESSMPHRTFTLDFSKPSDSDVSIKEWVRLSPSVLRIDGESVTSPLSGDWLNDIDLSKVTVTKDEQGNIVQIGLHSKAAATPTAASLADDDKIYDNVEVMPAFPGGPEALYKWLDNTLRYPEAAQKQKVQGRVHVQFVVEIDGSITNAKAAKSPSELLSDEALRVVKLMPRWEPGKVKGKPVRTYFNLPVVFKLPK